MGALKPVDPNTGAAIAPGSYSPAQTAAAALEKRQGDNELISLGLSPVPTGDTNADRAFLTGYVATQANTRY